MEFIPAKHLVIKNKSTEWFGADYTMNIYRGCHHGCIYCDSMSECYRIDDFGTVRAKEHALRIIRDDLSSKVKRGVVGTGSMSDPYNAFEREHQLTRNALQLLDAYEFGVAIATKSDLIVRDIDILQDIARHSPVICKITITTTDDALAAKLEPEAPRPTARLAAVRALADAGLFTGVLLMPTLPFLEDSLANVSSVLEAAAAAGAQFVLPAFGMTLRDRQRESYLAALERLFPGEGLREKYQRTFGTRYQCTSPNAHRLWAATKQLCHEPGLRYEMKSITAAYKRPYAPPQISMF